ncbi:hypothetical protein JANAI62_08670 [Jannaschia pagri]|uniref:Uncharacterized protein n=1 Tax=Jannaschia pagri TaxID=2829797 RepID=A0ABQ4NJ64_9RHOB|nr:MULTISPECIES: hypothetical protein [unclassified Jannaschia]GIT89648.1 hypothetical protein JANAI61_01060 [Jannaschia sp. AI_61]GIT94244.1 hypothetical protein JANAI62_08670 [Jannaschia sp. AI_62]
MDDYAKRLTAYGAVLMGRATYDVGLAHGLLPGASPYPGLACYVVSRSLQPLEEVGDLSDLGGTPTLLQRAGNRSTFAVEVTWQAPCLLPDGSTKSS